MLRSFDVFALAKHSPTRDLHTAPDGRSTPVSCANRRSTQEAPLNYRGPLAGHRPYILHGVGASGPCEYWRILSGSLQLSLRASIPTRSSPQVGVPLAHSAL
jgi:hypothetical protein